MKKMRHCFGILLTALMIFYTSPARAQLVFGMSISFLEEAGAAVKNVMEQVQTVHDQVIVKVREKVTEVKAKVASYFTKGKNAVGKIPGAKEFADNSSVDIYDLTAVKTSVHELFLQYPSDKPRIMAAYEDVAVTFYYDNLIEIYTASKKLEEQLDNLRKDVDSFAEGLTDVEASQSNDSQTVEGEDENGNYYNLYKANKKYNDILKVTQEVMAMSAQLMTAKYMSDASLLPPAPFDRETMEDPSDNVSNTKSQGSDGLLSKVKDGISKEEGKALLDGGKNILQGGSGGIKNVLPKVLGSTSIKHKETIAFAQVLQNSDLKPAPSATAKTETIGGQTVTYDTEISKVPLVKAQKVEVTNKLYSNIGKMEDLAELSAIQTIIYDALRAHNTLQLLPSYRELYVQYDLHRQLHAKSVERLAEADQCVVDYLGRHYQTPKQVWFGRSEAPKVANAYDTRRGISGWAITAFKVTNAEKTQAVNVDSLATPDIEADYESEELDADVLGNEVSDIDDTYALANPSEESEFSASVRDAEMVVFLVGAEAAKVLAKDQYSEKPKYVPIKERFPVWNDQKNFYNQYLEGKYENMRRYIWKANIAGSALDLARKINNGLKDEIVDAIVNERNVKISVRQENDKAFDQLATRVGGLDADDNKVTAILRQKEAALVALGRKEAAELAPHEAKLVTLGERLDTISNVITALNEQIKDSDRVAAESKLSAEAANAGIIREEEKQQEYETPMLIAHQTSFEENAKASLEAMENASNLRIKVKELEADRALVSANIESVNQAIADIKGTYSDKKNTEASAWDEKVESLEDCGDIIAGMEKALKNFSALRGALDKCRPDSLADIANGISGGTIPESVGRFAGILASVDAATNIARDRALDLIDDAENEIKSLGDQIYEPSGHAKVLAIHRGLISKLKSLGLWNSVGGIIKGTITGGASAIVSAANGLFQSTLVSGVCSGNACNNPDEEYFVGMPSKARDFVAPKSPFAERYAHVRDIVSFDITDYQDIEKGPDGVITKEEFLKYGGNIPQIWKDILADKPFVEKPIDLAKILGSKSLPKKPTIADILAARSKFSEQDVAYLRGGLYPCRVSKYIIDVAKNKNNGFPLYVYKDITNNAEATMPICHKIIATSPMGFLSKKLPIKIFGVEDEIDGAAIPCTDNEVKGYNQYCGKAVGGSELGLLLKYESGKLKLNDMPVAGFENTLSNAADIKKMRKQKNKKKFKFIDLIYTEAALSQNQIGNFIHFVDKETGIQKSVDEIKISIDDATVDLRNLLIELGFDPGEEINLSDAEEYEYIRKKIEDNKNSLMATITSRLSAVSTADPLILPIYNKVDNTRLAMLQDSDELLALNADLKAGNPLAEKLLTEKANKKVIEKATQESYDAIRKEIEEFEVPMCVVY